MHNPSLKHYKPDDLFCSMKVSVSMARLSISSIVILGSSDIVATGASVTVSCECTLCTTDFDGGVSAVGVTPSSVSGTNFV